MKGQRGEQRADPLTELCVDRPRAGVIWWSGATVVLHEHRLDPLLAEAEARVRSSPPAESASGADHVQEGRDRSHEDAALERGPAASRAQGRRHPADQFRPVDIVNWCSLEFQVPYGLYDAAKISGAVTMPWAAKGSRIPAFAKMM